MALALVVFNFFLPFFVLLFRENKRKTKKASRVALWILFMHWVNLVWLVIPASSDPASPRILWIEILLSAVLTVGIGGIWIAFYIHWLKAPASGAALRPQPDRGTRARRRSLNMADYLPQASTTGQTGHGHEANTLVVKGLIIFAVVLVAVGIVVEFCLVYVMKDFSQEEKVLQALAPPRFADDSGPFPASATASRAPHRPGQAQGGRAPPLEWIWMGRPRGRDRAYPDRSGDRYRGRRRALPPSGGPGREKRGRPRPNRPQRPASRRDRTPSRTGSHDHQSRNHFRRS